MNQIPGIVDVTTDLQITSPQILVEINRDKAPASELAPVRSSVGKRLWRSPDLHHLHAYRSVSGDFGSRRGFQA